MSPPKVKVCCISSIDEAHRAVQAGAAVLGLVSAMPSGPGVIDDAMVADIAAAMRGRPVRTFLLTARTRALDIAAQHAAAGTTTLQLVDHVPHDDLRRLRGLLPGVELVQVIHVTGESALAEASQVAPLVDAILLDSGNPALAVKELGGTGRTHDWALSREIVESVSVPVYLAGGLHPLNVADAVRQVRPFGVDVCSGLRTDGALDQSKVSAFVEALRTAGV